MPTRASACVVALFALPLLAGCGGGSSNSSAASTAAGSSQQQTTGTETVKTAQTGLGTVLVDKTGRTIYLFKKDTGTSSTCSGACIANWPAVTVTGAPTAGSGVTASMLGTTRRSDGSTQVTYGGHPLYRFSGDSASGDTNGQGVTAFGAVWYVVGPNGSAITTSGSGGGSSRGGY